MLQIFSFLKDTGWNYQSNHSPSRRNAPSHARGSCGCSSSRPFAATLPAPQAPSSPAATRTALITASLPLASPLIPLLHTAPGWLAGWQLVPWENATPSLPQPSLRSLTCQTGSVDPLPWNRSSPHCHANSTQNAQPTRCYFPNSPKI